VFSNLSLRERADFLLRGSLRFTVHSVLQSHGRQITAVDTLQTLIY